MNRRFVVISGLPGSGKSTLARRLTLGLHLPVIDKDEILERLFESKGFGSVEQRRLLSRDSDAILQAEATAAAGAILVSHWRQSGMPADSGTPTEWLFELSDRIVQVHCACDPETAAKRFFDRRRHPGHLDSARSYAEVLASIQALAHLEPLDAGLRITVDTSKALGLDEIVLEIWEAFERRP